MEKSEERYTLSEISAASKINRSTLNGRRKRLGIPSNRRGYTLEEVKQMIKWPAKRKFIQLRADKLREQLLNDGAL